MLPFSPSPDVLHSFAQEVVKVSAFNDEVRKLAGLAEVAEMPVRDAARHVGGAVAKHIPAAAAGAGLLYAGKRLKDDVQAGEALRRQGGY